MRIVNGPARATVLALRARGRSRIVMACVVIAALASIVVRAAPSSAADEPPRLSASDRGSRIDDVSIDAYGVTDPTVAKRYLSLHAGTETAASRIRGSERSFVPSTFAWRADSGIGAMYRGFRLNVARGNEGGRITYECSVNSSNAAVALGIAEHTAARLASAC